MGGRQGGRAGVPLCGGAIRAKPSDFRSSDPRVGAGRMSAKKRAPTIEGRQPLGDLVVQILLDRRAYRWLRTGGERFPLTVGKEVIEARRSENDISWNRNRPGQNDSVFEKPAHPVRRPLVASRNPD